MPKETREPSPRFGIAEWFGRDTLELKPNQRRDGATLSLPPVERRLADPVQAEHILHHRTRFLLLQKSR